MFVVNRRGPSGRTTATFLTQPQLLVHEVHEEEVLQLVVDELSMSAVLDAS